jgi:hypothetical protein
MNIRWPIWIPAARRDAFLFAVLAVCTGYLLLGHFQNLPLIPSIDRLPDQAREVYFWLAVVSLLNYSIVLKNSRNDYIYVSQQLLPCALTTLVVVSCLAVIIGYQNRLSSNTPTLENARYLLYAEIHAFVILNVSFLFKETSSPVREISNDVRALDQISRTSRTILDVDERREKWNTLFSAAQSLASTFAKHSAVMSAQFKIGQASYSLSGAAKAVADQVQTLGPEVVFKRLADPESELARLVRGIVANATKS